MGVEGEKRGYIGGDISRRNVFNIGEKILSWGRGGGGEEVLDISSSRGYLICLIVKSEKSGNICTFLSH